MKHPNNFANLYFIITDLGHSILKKITDYQNQIDGNPVIKKGFFHIEFVYMHSIILDIAKLIAVTGADKSGLRQLKSISPKDILDRIDKFEIKYQPIISKIANNRNRVISHIDISDVSSYFKMGFSAIEIERMIADYTKSLSIYGQKEEQDPEFISKLTAMKSESAQNERYSPSDFVQDLETIKEMINEVLSIASDLNLHFYKIQ